MDCLIQSIKIEPWNWSAWLKLASCIEGPEEVGQTKWTHLSAVN